MKNIALILAASAALGLAAGMILADVAPNPYPTPQKPQSLYGTVATAADDKGAFEVTPKDEKEGKRVSKYPAPEVWGG
ncbi:MAG: hypothetical protein HZA50_16070 [Planctomycetes bacterium]|nr:hypothetical protein [Planctomycetota bacterium]